LKKIEEAIGEAVEEAVRQDVIDAEDDSIF
jgi:hypothetical protein